MVAKGPGHGSMEAVSFEKDNAIIIRSMSASFQFYYETLDLSYKNCYGCSYFVNVKCWKNEVNKKEAKKAKKGEKREKRRKKQKTIERLY